MNTSLRAVLLALPAGGLLALAGCSNEPRQEAEPGDQRETPTPPPRPMATVAPTPSPAPTASPTVAAREIPASIRGRWGMVPADCTSTRGDAKGLLTITAKDVRFYESVAELGEVKEQDANRIRAGFTFTGEGQTWKQDMVLDAQGDGNTLIRRDYGPDAMPGPLEYKRCQ